MITPCPNYVGYGSLLAYDVPTFGFQQPESELQAMSGIFSHFKLSKVVVKYQPTPNIDQLLEEETDPYWRRLLAHGQFVISQIDDLNFLAQADRSDQNSDASLYKTLLNSGCKLRRFDKPFTLVIRPRALRTANSHQALFEHSSAFGATSSYFSASQMRTRRSAWMPFFDVCYNQAGTDVGWTKAQFHLFQILLSTMLMPTEALATGNGFTEFPAEGSTVMIGTLQFKFYFAFKGRRKFDLYRDSLVLNQTKGAASSATTATVAPSAPPPKLAAPAMESEREWEGHAELLDEPDSESEEGDSPPLSDEEAEELV